MISLILFQSEPWVLKRLEDLSQIKDRPARPQSMFSSLSRNPSHPSVRSLKTFLICTNVHRIKKLHESNKNRYCQVSEEEPLLQLVEIQ